MWCFSPAFINPPLNSLEPRGLVALWNTLIYPSASCRIYFAYMWRNQSTLCKWIKHIATGAHSPNPYQFKWSHLCCGRNVALITPFADRQLYLCLDCCVCRKLREAMNGQKNEQRAAMRAHFRRKYQLSEVCWFPADQPSVNRALRLCLITHLCDFYKGIHVPFLKISHCFLC